MPKFSVNNILITLIFISGKVSYVTAIFPYIQLIVLIINSVKMSYVTAIFPYL